MGGDGLEINDSSDKSFILRRMRLFQLASNAIDNAARSENTSKKLEDILKNAILDIKSTMSSGGSEGVYEKNRVVQHVYNEPLAKESAEAFCDQKSMEIGNEHRFPSSKDRPNPVPSYNDMFRIVSMRVKGYKEEGGI
ncbi:hypothetical protein LWI28_008956 [Acer negundo]|uniref:Uncharacterized protein n=1 Tax=Acer negundo TaxID=4023 RepID=A0AAD5NXH5_ACENE|nr:hypothetical protein LWI28_008956 [Acer negundo]